MLDQHIFLNHLRPLVAGNQDANFLLGVSGGVDSMVLATLFLQAGLPFQVAHINYNLRGEASRKDRDLVTAFCEAHHIKMHLYEVTEADALPEHSIQLWARNLRYGFFKKIMTEEHLDFLVTAHHLDDDLETFLIHLSKASGLRGLAGIPKAKNNILRPLLAIPKEDIYRFAALNHVEFREDESNAKNDYLRNRIRNTVVPKLLETNEKFRDNFGKSIDILKQAEQLLNSTIEEKFGRLAEIRNGKTLLNKLQLLAELPLVQFEILRKFGFESEGEIQKILAAENGKTFFSKKFQLVANREAFVIIRNNGDEAAQFTDLHPEENTIFINQIGGPPFCWHIDADAVSLPLRLRQKEPGDRIHPLGMQGSKAVGKFFRDLKLPTFALQHTPVLCDSQNRIIGLPPYRQDRRFAASKDCKHIIKITNNLPSK